MIERIKKLEQSNRRMKKYMISLHIILVGMLVVGFQSTAIPDVIEARKLVIKDDKGNDRITLSVDENTSHIRMTDEGEENIHLQSSTIRSFLNLKQKESFVSLQNWQSVGILVMESERHKSEYMMNTYKGFTGYKFQKNDSLDREFNLGFKDDEFRFKLVKGSSGDVYSIINNKEGTNYSVYDSVGNKSVTISNQDLIDKYENRAK